ncbi:MAG: hypothetical protein ACUVQY_00735 [Thermoproteota archaeon]
MVKEATTRLYTLTKRIKGKTYSTMTLYLPSKIVNDSAFPLKRKGKLVVKIVANKVVIENEKKARRRRRIS